MSIQSNPSGFLRLLARMLATSVGVGLLAVIIFNDSILHFFFPAVPQPMKLIAALESDGNHPAIETNRIKLTEAPPAQISIEVNSGKTANADPAFVSSLQNFMAPTDDSFSENWSKWAHLEGGACQIASNHPDSSSYLKIYAVKYEGGVTVFLMNQGAEKSKIQVGTRLSHGIYTVEKLSLVAPGAEIKTGLAKSSSEISTVNSQLPKLSRQIGADLTSDSFAKNSLTLESGQLYILKFTDSALSARQAYNEMRDRLRQLSYVAPVAADKLNAIINGFDTTRIGLGATGSPRAGDRVGRIHGFLLALFQVHTLHKNFLDKKAVPEAIGNRLMDSVDRLNILLSETSVNLLKLVPEIEMVPEIGVANFRTASRQNSGVASDPPVSWVVMLKLTNLGKRTARDLKLGIKVKSLPQEVSCSPTEPDYFATLTPGQSVSATYHLISAQGASALQNRCVGEISYFSANVVAHIYLSPR